MVKGKHYIFPTETMSCDLITTDKKNSKIVTKVIVSINIPIFNYQNAKIYLPDLQ